MSLAAAGVRTAQVARRALLADQVGSGCVIGSVVGAAGWAVADHRV